MASTPRSSHYAAVRGVGKKSIELLETANRAYDRSLWQTLVDRAQPHKFVVGVELRSLNS